MELKLLWMEGEVSSFVALSVPQARFDREEFKTGDRNSFTKRYVKIAVNTKCLNVLVSSYAKTLGMGSSSAALRPLYG